VHFGALAGQHKNSPRYDYCDCFEESLPALLEKPSALRLENLSLFDRHHSPSESSSTAFNPDDDKKPYASIT
jgi:hypothetical protein